MKIDKKNRTLLALLLVIVVLGACYLGIKAYNQNQKEAAALEEEANKIYMTNVENAALLRYDIGNGEMAFESEDDVWVVQDDPDFPLAQTYVQAIVAEFGNLQAERKLEDGDELACYGLDEPAYWIELTDEDGTATLIRVGDPTSEDYTSFYAMVNEDETVYTISSTSLDYLDYALEDMAQLDMMPTIGSGNLLRETITADGESVTYDAENDDDAEAIAKVAGGLGALSLDTEADYSVSDEDLAQYGLDETSRITVEAVYTNDEEEETVTLFFGGESGQDTTYVMIGESCIVYEVTTEICQNVLNQ